MTILFDIALLVGVALVACAGWLIHPALALLVCGCSLSAWGVCGARSRIKRDK